MKKIKLAIGKNNIFQIVNECQNELSTCDIVINSWKNKFNYQIEKDNLKGLRTPQIGALYSIKSHWTISNKPATIVMPTGTGKSETMIATIVSEEINKTLIVVPSKMLRKQTVDKFIKFGVLQSLGVISKDAILPTVAMLECTPNSLEELKELINKSNIIVVTMSLLKNFNDSYLSLFSTMCSTLIIDEAHHIAAKTWSKIKYKLQTMRCLQFTATPFRNDGKKIDGKIIYNFPLSKAQEQEYFKPINFIPIMEFDDEKSHFAIAQKAIECLENDMKNGFNHIVLVRAKDKKSANYLFKEIYKANFEKYNPVIIHSDISKREIADNLIFLKNGKSHIVVCVDMFGEGIDIPSLKIAAIHDKYMSLPITLQFIGRFARTGEGLGNATVVTNIANDELKDIIKELYEQDADWNSLLKNLSDVEIGKELSIQELSQGFNNSMPNGIAINQFRPKVSMTAYKIDSKTWNINSLDNLFTRDSYTYTLNSEKNILLIIEKINSKVEWTSFQGISDTNWHFHLLYWNKKIKVAFVNSTNKNISDKLCAGLFDKYERIQGEQVFRCLHGINRLMLGTIGLKTGIDGAIRFRMFAGLDIGQAISESQKEKSTKSNLFGVGYNGKGKTSIGCSYKGRIWSRWVEHIDFWMLWCDEIASKLLDESIDTNDILEGILIPEVIKELPSDKPYSIEWPIDLEIINDNSFVVYDNFNEYNIFDLDIKLLENQEPGSLQFKICNELISESYKLIIDDKGYRFNSIKPSSLNIKYKRNIYTITDFFNENPPLIKFVDQSSLEGKFLVKIKNIHPRKLDDQIITFPWEGIDIRKESQGKNFDQDSIQYYMIQKIQELNKFDIIFDDDGSGEIADIVCISERDSKIRIHLFHCKYSSEEKPGARIGDLYEVCGQAEKSVKWFQDPIAIANRIIQREINAQRTNRSRFITGNLQKINEIKNKMKLFKTYFDVTIVQPGVNSNNISEDMNRLLNGTASYMIDTYGIKLQMIFS